MKKYYTLSASIIFIILLAVLSYLTLENADTRSKVTDFLGLQKSQFGQASETTESSQKKLCDSTTSQNTNSCLFVGCNGFF